MARLGSRIARAVLLAALVLPAAAANAADRSGGLLPVPTLTIERGDRITADMLTEKHFYFDPARPLAVLRDPSEAVGKAARRTLHAGKPIPQSAFAPVKVIVRGRPVEARYKLGNLTISATVLAQDDGAVGDLVRARNLDSGRTITGLVTADGAIEVSGL